MINFKFLDRLAARLTYLRNNQKMTQAQLAEASGLSLDTIQRFERGKSTPALESLRKVALGLGLPIADLFVAVDSAEARGEGHDYDDPTLVELLHLLRSMPEFPVRELVDLLRAQKRLRAP